MDSKKIAEALVAEVNGYPEVLADLKKVVLKTLSTVLARTWGISKEAFESEEKFFDVLSQLGDMFIKAPGLIEAFDGTAIKMVLKIIDKNFLDKYFGEDWLETLKNGTEIVVAELQLANKPTNA